MPAHTVSILDEDTLTLTQAAQSLGVSAASTWRWARGGIRGVRLDYIRMGRRILTSREALQRFADELTAKDQGGAYPATTSIEAADADRFDVEAEAEGL